jgi:hypothetical protein
MKNILGGVFLLVFCCSAALAQQNGSAFERSMPRIEHGREVHTPPASADHSIPSGVTRGGVSVEIGSGTHAQDSRGNTSAVPGAHIKTDF